MQTIEIINGIFSLLIVLIFAICGLLIALKYFNVKNKIYIFWGVGIFGMGIGWGGGAFSFLSILLTGQTFSLAQYLFISLGFFAFTMPLFMYTLTELLIKEKQKIILGFYIVIGIIYEIYLIFFLLVNVNVIGKFDNPPLDISYSGLSLLYSLYLTISVCIFLGWFIAKSWRSDQDEVRIKARFNLVGLISWTFGVIFDGFLSVNIVTVFIIRIILIASAIEFYIGWILPEPVKKLFIKE